MALMEGLLQAPGSFTLLVAVLLLLLVWLYSSGVSNPEKGKEPPGPRPLPILGNLLMLDMHKLYETLCEVRVHEIFTGIQTLCPMDNDNNQECCHVFHIL